MDNLPRIMRYKINHYVKKILVDKLDISIFIPFSGRKYLNLFRLKENGSEPSYFLFPGMSPSGLAINPCTG